jgi:hypothetical protein
LAGSVEPLLPIELTRSTTLPKSALASPPMPLLLPPSSYLTVRALAGMSVIVVVWRVALRQALVSGPMPSVTL